MKSDTIGTFSLRSIQVIDDKIRNCSNPKERLVLFAKRSGGLAAHSYIAEAKTTVAELREANADFDPRLTGWIIYAEGLIEHFETLNNKKSKYKFSRGLLVGQMVADRELAGVCSAWVAHCEFVDGKISSAAGHIINAFEWSLPSEHETRGRASMVLADAFNAADQIDKSRHWFRSARNHASHAGDIAMQNVMLFNIAAYSVARLTLDDCTHGFSSKDRQRTGMEASSAANLNSALGISELPTMIPTMQAELLIVDKKWYEAISILGNHPSDILRNSPSRLVPKLLAQRAWCHANIGDFLAADRDLQRSLEKLSACTDDDDAAVLQFRLSRTEEIMGRADVASSSLDVAKRHLALFRVHQKNIESMLDDVILNISGK